MRFTITVSFIVITMLIGALDPITAKAQEPPDSYLDIINSCSDWADSNGKDAVAYREYCVKNEWQAMITAKVLKKTNMLSLSPAHTMIIKELSDWRTAKEGCQGLGDEYFECMDYQAYLIVEAITEEFKILNKGIYDIKASLGHYAKTFKNYAGYPLCKDVLEQAGDHHAKILMHLITQGLVIEGEPLETNYLLLPNNTYEAMQMDGWTVESVTTYPTPQTIRKNKAYSENFQHPSSGGCFPGETKVTALSTKDGWIFKSYNPVMSSAVDSITDDLFAGKVDINEIKTGNLVLSNTRSAVAQKGYQRDCWAEVKDVYQSTTGEWRYDSLFKVKYDGPDWDEVEILVTPKHAFLSNAGRWVAPENDYFEGISLTGLEFISPVEGLEKKSVDADTKIYNLFVPNTFVYYVGEKPLLVHNLIMKD